jgi:hypothetical protein
MQSFAPLKNAWENDVTLADRIANAFFLASAPDVPSAAQQ